MSAKVLLVEDNDQNRYLATYLLENAGFSVCHAINGHQAIEAARREKPALILMDIQMPEMEGYEPARRIKEDPSLVHIPLVAVTSYAMAGDRDRALEQGFVGYIEKPIPTESFI